MKQLRFVVLAASAAVVSACGGGGGGTGGGVPGGGTGGTGSGSNSFHLSFSPAALTAQVTQGAVETGIIVNATLSQQPTGTYYIVITADADVLDAANTYVYIQSPTSAAANVAPSCALTPGTYSGVLTVRLCADQSCTQQLPVSGNTLPYTFTVSPGLVVTAKVDGVPQPGFAAACTSNLGAVQVSTNVGQKLELTSTQPVTWSASEVNSFGFPCWSGTTSDATTWSATISERGIPTYPGMLGGFSVSAKSAGATPMSFNIGVGGMSTATSPPTCD
jgi:hypothetical protein